MKSVSKQIELSQLSLNSFNFRYEFGVSPAGSSGNHSHPAVLIGWNDCDRPVRLCDRIFLSDSFEKQMDQFICRNAFSLHSLIIAETAGFANSRGAR